MNFIWKSLKDLQRFQITEDRLDNFLILEASLKQETLLKLYFFNKDIEILEKIKKEVLWNFLVRTNNFSELIIWTRRNANIEEVAFCQSSAFPGFQNKYDLWKVDDSMIEYAVKTIENPSEVLKDLFASRGFFFPETVSTSLKRLSTELHANCWEQRNRLSNLPIFLFQHKLFGVMLEDVVSTEDLKKFEGPIMEIVCLLKEEKYESKEDFLQLSIKARKLLETKYSVDDLVYIFEMLCQDFENYSSFCESLSSTGNIFMQRFKSTSEPNISAYDFFKKTKSIDWTENIKDMPVTPSFADQKLNEKFGHKFKVTFLHYLKQQRSQYAVYFFILEQLNNYSQISKSQLFSCSEIVTELVLLNYQNTDLMAHCIAFQEVLGFDTQILRNYCQLLNLTGGEGNRFEKLVEKVEETVYKKGEFPLKEYQAIVRVAKCGQNEVWPGKFINEFCRLDDWWKILIIAQYFDFPLNWVKDISKSFKSRNMGDNFWRALAFEPACLDRMNKRRPSISRQRSRAKAESSHSNSNELIVGSSEPINTASKTNHLRTLQEIDNEDLFGLILLSTTNLPEEHITNITKFLEVLNDSNLVHCTSINLMKNCIKFHLPILSILSATVSPLNIEWNWLIWLTVNTGCDQEFIKYPISVHNVIEFCVLNGFVAALDRSFKIFFNESNFCLLTHFLNDTNKLIYTDETLDFLKTYLLFWSQDKVYFPFCNISQQTNKDKMILLTIRLILLHLKYNFQSAVHKRQFLLLLCKSGISDLYIFIDFDLLKNVFDISLALENYDFDFEKLILEDNTLYTDLLDKLISHQLFDESIKLAGLLNQPICSIVLTKWTSNLNIEYYSSLVFEQYELEMEELALPPEILINFLLYTAAQLQQSCRKRYLLFKKAMEIIKKHHLFPNENFDRDQIEYEMVMCYLLSNDKIECSDIYLSEYFEEIMSKERGVLYKSFKELKELAGIDELTPSTKIGLNTEMKDKLETLLNKLLDLGDIVEALRIQALFEYRSMDLHFLVFCMALAEGLTTIQDMTKEEKVTLTNISCSIFNKRTLGRQAQKAGNSPKHLNYSDTGSAMEFEEIPSKDKNEILKALQGLASRLKHGIYLGKRIVLVYRASMFLDKDYVEVLTTKDTSGLLKSAGDEECMNKLLVISDILTSTQRNFIEIAEFLSYEIATSIIRPRFYIFSIEHQVEVLHQFKNAILWGYDLDKEFHLIIELAPKTTLLGKGLLEFCDALRTYRKFQDQKPYQITQTFLQLKDIITQYGFPNDPALNSATQVLSHKKQNLICVELLIKAHQCFIHECSMEGIANVLNRAKSLNVTLTSAKSWSLIVRLLTGIGRYREMFYCFDSLIENEQFESLLGQFDDEKVLGLRQAIIVYLKEKCPENKEYQKLTALHFSMYKKLAEIWEEDAELRIEKVLLMSSLGETATDGNPRNIVTEMKCSKDILTILNQAMESLTHATENYLLENKLKLAQKTATKAQLIAMQIDLATKGLNGNKTCISVLAINTKEEFREILNYYLTLHQALLFCGYYDNFDANWSEILLYQYIILERKEYLNDFLEQMDLTDAIIENILRHFQNVALNVNFKVTTKMELCLEDLVLRIQSITLKYKMASLLNFKKIIMSLINDHPFYYLKDSNYGKIDIHY
ncbi:SPG11 family protein [Megaselia abdita]